MKNVKTMKAKTATTAAKPAAKAPETQALEVAPERKRSAKVTAAKAPATPSSRPPQDSRPAATGTAAQGQITSDLIAARAYILWEKQGRPHGSDLANWLLAESQLKQEIQSFTA